MKIQCSCGAKYAFDITPEMVRNPVRFVCPACGLDSSDYVNRLVRAEFAEPAGSAAPPPPASPPPPAVAPGLKIAHEAPPTAPPSAAPAGPNVCTRHRGVRATEHCAICQKPICPQCLALFGYFCSPLCKAKAEAQNIAVPVYAGRHDLVEARFWRRTGLLFGLVMVTLVAAVGFWIWYAWIGSVPHPVFSVRFADDDRAYSGGAQLVGKDQDQIVFLHGGTLARYDLKTKSPVWSAELVTKQQIADLVQAETAAEARQDAESADGYHHRRRGADIERSAKQALDAELSLHVAGQSVWVSRADQLTRYDWASGKVAQTITLPDAGGGLVQNGDELVLPGAQSVTQIDLATGESHVESLTEPGAAPVLTARSSPGGGLPATGGSSDQPLDPQKTAAQVQNMSLPARIALPALVGNAAYEQRLESELKDGSQSAHPRSTPLTPARTEAFRIVAGPDDFAGFAVRLLESRMVTHSAIKPTTGKSALDSGSVGVMNETAAVNEQLNEMQHNRGGDTVTENESRYQVTVHLPAAGTPDWTGEVIGPPQLFVLKTVNVIAAGKTVIVLDKSNKQLWQTTLTYNLPGGESGFSGDASRFGAGPCVEHGDTLYVFDQAVLGAFDLTTGNARWRLPSVGIVGLFIDDHDDVYVNTTSGNPDDIKYSRQIDVTRKTEAVVFKIDARTGKTLWSIKPGGYVSYVSGKFVYLVQANDPDPDDTQTDTASDLTSALQQQPFMRLKRLRPSDGRILWDYEQARAPFEIVYHQNSIVLVYKKEVQVLRYLSF